MTRKDIAMLAEAYTQVLSEGIDNAEKQKLITAVRYFQKTGDSNKLREAESQLHAWAKQNNAYSDPDVLEFIDPPAQQSSNSSSGDKDKLITAVRFYRKAGDRDRLRKAESQLHAWAKQNNGYNDPDVLDVLDYPNQ